MKFLNTFLQVSIYLSIALILFTLSLNFVSVLDIYPVDVESGIDTTGSTDSVFTKFTGLSGGMEIVWSTILTIAGIGAVAVAILMHSAIPVGAYIFSAVFWTSYIRSISVINIDGIFNADPMASFLLIGTVGILFLWCAAIVGIFTGSG